MAKRVSGVNGLFIGAAPVTGNPTNDAINWTGLGKPLNGWEPGNETTNVEDGKGAPIQADASVTRIYELIDMDSFDEIDTPEQARTRQDVAELLLNGDYRIYRNCKVFVEYLPNPGKGNIQTLQFMFSTAADDWSKIRDIVVPI